MEAQDPGYETPEAFVERFEKLVKALEQDPDEYDEDFLKRCLALEIWKRDATMILKAVSLATAYTDRTTREDQNAITDVVKDLAEWLLKLAVKRNEDGELFREVASLEVSGDAKGLSILLSKHAMEETRFGVRK